MDSESSWVDPVAAGPLGRRRQDVLECLRDAGDAVSVADVAAHTHMHVNTARFHLDGLVADGLAERRSEDRDVPGRPRILYSSTGPAVGPRSFRLLAEMLTGLVSGLDDPRPAAVEAGRSWGRHLVERPAPSERIDGDEATARLLRVLADVGFRPESGAEEDGDRDVLLHHCPFREVAERHTDVVCGLHLGLMQGALAELRAPVESPSLDPFVTPQLCVAHLRTVSVPS
ncbi:MAG TPA: helix-turn-helix domain-containing protein [Mycobacteriales bacterium]